MSNLQAFIAGLLVAFFLSWLTAPRRAWSAERELVARCVLECWLLVCLRLPDPVARWLAYRWPVAFLTL